MIASSLEVRFGICFPAEPTGRVPGDPDHTIHPGI
jgi:hypothetical protein